MDIREITSNTKRHPWELARYEILKGTLAKLQHNASFNLLDIGCGDQFILSNLSVDFPEVKLHGIDIALSDSEIEAKRLEKPNITIYNHYHEDLKIKEFDFVLLLDVIEHIEKVDGFFKEINENLKVSNSYFIITVPAFNSLFSQHDDFLGHFRRYTKRSLRNELGKSGFKEVKIHYFFLSLFIARFFEVKLISFFRKFESKGVGQWQKSDLITKIVKNILLADYALGNAFRKIGLKLPGLSLISINILKKEND